MRYTVRPISDRTWLRPAGKREYHRFDSKWSATEQLLGREIAYLNGRDVVIEIDVREHDVKLDGTLRANARTPETPAVVVAFESKHGPMLYRSDRYEGRWGTPGWQANVRAVALTLEALRAVDRYGATETGQQYAGFKALPAGRAMPASHMTRDAAAELLERVAIGDDEKYRIRTIQRILDSPELATDVFREARKVAHPDRRNGDHAVWHQVEEAGRVLGVAR